MIGVDIGTSKVRVVIGSLASTDGPDGRSLDDDAITIVGVGEYASQGMRKGTKADIGKVTISLDKAMAVAEGMSGVDIQEAVVGIGEVVSYIAKSRCSEYGIANGVYKYIGIGVPHKSVRMRYLDSSHNKPTPESKAVYVVSESYSNHIVGRFNIMRIISYKRYGSSFPTEVGRNLTPA